MNRTLIVKALATHLAGSLSTIVEIGTDRDGEPARDAAARAQFHRVGDKIFGTVVWCKYPTYSGDEMIVHVSLRERFRGEGGRQWVAAVWDGEANKAACAGEQNPISRDASGPEEAVYAALKDAYV